MQPLSYQMSKNTCWITSMLNGILLLVGRDQISSHDYVLLNDLLNSLLGEDGVVYYEEEDFRQYKKVIKRVAGITNLEITCQREDEVESAIQQKFKRKKRVAVCDITTGAHSCGGEHSILIHGEETSNNVRWLHCFDPWWENVRNKNNNPLQNLYRDLYEHCNGHTVNVKIKEDHLLAQNGTLRKQIKIRKFTMGEIGWRFKTVMKKRSTNG